MPVRQKTFRIEQMAPSPRGMSAEGASAAPEHHEVLNELKALRELIEQWTPNAPPIEPVGNGKHAVNAEHITAGDLDKLKRETDSIYRAISRTKEELASLHFGAFSEAGQGRASRELDAVVDSTERATQQILEAAEAIDEAANTLSASLRQKQEQALAGDVRDHVVPDIRGLQFPRPQRPAHRQGADDAEIRRGPREPHAGNLGRPRRPQGLHGSGGVGRNAAGRRPQAHRRPQARGRCRAPLPARYRLDVRLAEDGSETIAHTNRFSIVARRERAEAPYHGVIAGLDPATSLRDALCPPKRDGRDIRAFTP